MLAPDWALRGSRRRPRSATQVGNKRATAPAGPQRDPTNSPATNPHSRALQRTHTALWRRLITRRSRVRIPPPLFTGKPLVERLSAFLGRSAGGPKKASGQPRGQQLARNRHLRWLRGPPSVADGKRHTRSRRSANCPGPGIRGDTFDGLGSSPTPVCLPDESRLSLTRPAQPPSPAVGRHNGPVSDVGAHVVLRRSRS